MIQLHSDKDRHGGLSLRICICSVGTDICVCPADYKGNYLNHTIYILFITIPVIWIIDDIFPDTIKGYLISDNVIIK